MKLTRLEVAGYGIWTGLRVEDFGPGLNVIYGPNEAGKTTLLEFLRWVLYGSSSTRGRYIPPFHGGRAGGSIQVAGDDGLLEIARWCPERADSLPEEQLVVRTADGSQHGGEFLTTLLGGVDEATFINVFAISLWELQELASLGDTQAADLLYNLSLGVDGRWLLEVMRELETSRRRIVNGPDTPAQLLQLLAERKRLRGELSALEPGAGTYSELVGQRRQLQADIAAVQSQRGELEVQLRHIELAATLAQQWQQRNAIDQQLASLPTEGIPVGTVAQLDRLQAAIKRRSRRTRLLRRRCRELARQAEGIELRKALWRQAPRIEAIAEQQPWLSSLQERIGQLEQEVDAIRASLDEKQQRLAVHDSDSLEALLQTPTATLRRLRPAMQAVAQARRTVRQAKQALAAARQEHTALAAELQTALSGRGEKDLAAALDRAGELVGQCRRKVQIDQRIEQILEDQREVEQQSHRLWQRQVLPLWLLAALGAVFALGVMLVLAGLLLPGTVTGSLGWAMALLGAGGVAVAAGGKLALERANARALDSCQKQLGLLQSQLQQLQQQRHDLQQQLGATNAEETGGAAGPARLAEAEKRLAWLEELAPLQSRVNAALDQVQQCNARLAQARAELRTARQQWAEALTAAALPDGLSPRQVRMLLLERRNTQEALQRLKLREEELAERRSQWKSLAERIEQLYADAGLAPASGDLLQQVQQLLRELASQREAWRQRTSIVRQRRKVLRRWKRQRTVLARLLRRRRRLFERAGVADEQEFRRRAELAARAAALRSQRDSLDSQIGELLSGQPDQQAVRDLLSRYTAPQLEEQLNRLREELSALDGRLQRLFQRQGQIDEQLKNLGGDRQLGFKRLDLSISAQRIKQAIRRWQVLAVCGRLLETICRNYESERQPETLRAASEYLRVLTGGRMLRVWTPLGDRTLRVDQADGRTLAVEALSRGTREQLFLSLRLALADWFARRGTRLPLILDDVLVNFDSQRAEAAARLLHRFAEDGHQLLVFTCHEHMLALFGELAVPVGRLPDCNRPNPPTLRLAPLERSKAQAPGGSGVVEIAPPVGHSRRQSRRPTVQREDKPAAESGQPAGAPVLSSQRRSFDADYFDSREPAASTGRPASGSNGAARSDDSRLPEAND